MPKSYRPPNWTRIAVGIVAGLMLHGVAGWWSPAALAAGATNQTITTSYSSSTFFESPPACAPVGSSRSVQTVTFEETIGPGTIIIGDRDNGGTAFQVLAGTTNQNVNTHTTIFLCVAAAAVAAIPALSWLALLLLGNLMAVLGAWQLARRRRSVE
jgi:hypothetical protein